MGRISFAESKKRPSQIRNCEVIVLFCRRMFYCSFHLLKAMQYPFILVAAFVQKPGDSEVGVEIDFNLGVWWRKGSLGGPMHNLTCTFEARRHKELLK